MDLAEYNLTWPVLPGFRSRDLLVEISRHGLKVGLRDRPPAYIVQFALPLDPDESHWQVESGELLVHLEWDRRDPEAACVRGRRGPVEWD